MGVMQALRLRYAPPAWALFEEVGNATGTMHSRRADAIAMSLWPSRGLELHGFEVKISRSDWVRERDDPAKAEVIAKRCDRWWLVVGDEKLVHDGELPPSWGLLVLKGDKLVTKVDAPKLEAEPLTRGFLAAILRRAHEAIEHMVPKAEIDQVVLERVNAETKRIEERLANRDIAAVELKMLRERVAQFEAASGVKIDGWDYENVGRAVEIILRGGLDHYHAMLERSAKSAEAIAKQARDELKKLDADLRKKTEAA